MSVCFVTCDADCLSHVALLTTITAAPRASYRSCSSLAAEPAILLCGQSVHSHKILTKCLEQLQPYLFKCLAQQLLELNAQYAPSPLLLLLSYLLAVLLALPPAYCAAAILKCCDLVTAGPATTNWTKALDGKGLTDCKGDDEPAPAPAASRLANSTTARPSMHEDHAGHDHSGHNHTAMADSKGTAAAAAANTTGDSSSSSKAKSGAAAVSCGSAVAAGAVLAALMLIAL